MFKYTIAIPVYNDASSLEKCLHSVLDQSIGLDSIEVICVNDGSTDDSPLILDQFSEQYSCIKVIHQKNSGSPSGPRNKAIEVATGDYIYFLDSDDYLGPKAIEKMAERVKEYDSDIVIGKYQGVNRNVPKAVFEKNEDCFNFIGSNALSTVGAQKLIRVSLLRENNIRFPEYLSLGEDQAFIIKAYAYSNSISIVKDYPCYYATNDQTDGRIQLTKKPISGEIFSSPIIECFKAIKELNISEEKRSRIYHQYWRRIFQVEINAVIIRPLLMEDKQQIINVLKDLLHESSFLNYYPLFSEQEKLYVRLIELGKLTDLLSYWYENKNNGSMLVYHDKIFPANEKARELAKVEGLSFHKQNEFSGFAIGVEINQDSIMLKGYCNHSLVKVSKQKLLVKLVSRSKEDAFVIPANVSSFVDEHDFCLKVEGKTDYNGSFFTCRIGNQFFLKDLQDCIYDVYIISQIEQYKKGARLGSNGLEDIKSRVNLDEGRKNIEFYRTTNDNFSIRVDKVANPQIDKNNETPPSFLSKAKNRLKKLVN